jgi:hypothetical protein
LEYRVLRMIGSDGGKFRVKQHFVPLPKALFSFTFVFSQRVIIGATKAASTTKKSSMRNNIALLQ